MPSLFDKDFSTKQLSGDFLKAYGSDPNVLGYYYDEETGQMHAKMKNGSIATYGANFKRYLATKDNPAPQPKPISEDEPVVTKTSTSSTTSIPPKVSPTPSTPYTYSPPPPPPPVKTAPIDTVLFNDDSVPIETMADLIFEDIGGQELINIVRNDTIIGQNIEYLPIKNITSINQQYDPNNILSLQNTSNKFFSNFVIPIDDKIPNIGTGPNNSFVYLDSSTGDLIIELVNLSSDNEIQVAFMTGGTIYEAEFNESW